MPKGKSRIENVNLMGKNLFTKNKQLMYGIQDEDRRKGFYRGTSSSNQRSQVIYSTNNPQTTSATSFESIPSVIESP
jgi:hypothetical protein